MNLDRQISKLVFPIANWFACDCAARVVRRFEAEFPFDDRPRNAIAIVRNHLLGRATIADVNEARIDADAAFWACPRGSVASPAARAVFNACCLKRRPPWQEIRQVAWAARLVSLEEETWQVERIQLLHEVASEQGIPPSTWQH